MLYSRTGHRWQYGACALHAGHVRLRTHTQNLVILLIAFLPQCYVLRTVHCLSCWWILCVFLLVPNVLFNSYLLTYCVCLFYWNIIPINCFFAESIRHWQRLKQLLHCVFSQSYGSFGGSGRGEARRCRVTWEQHPLPRTRTMCSPLPAKAYLLQLSR